CVARLAARVAASPLVKITSMPALTRAPAAAGIRSGFPSVSLTSKTTSRPSWSPRSRRPALRPPTVGGLPALASVSAPTRYGARVLWALAGHASAPTRARARTIAAKGGRITRTALLLDQRAVTLLQRSEGLGRRDGCAQFVEVPGAAGLGRLLHLEQVHRVD